MIDVNQRLSGWGGVWRLVRNGSSVRLYSSPFLLEGGLKIRMC